MKITPRIFSYSVLLFTLINLLSQGKPALAQISNTQLLMNLKSNVEQLNFQSSLGTLESNSQFATGKYRLVYYMEKGAMLHYLGRYRESNEWFTKADYYVEDYRRRAGEVVLTYLSNPNAEDYPGEDFEILFINYYKALNYIALNQMDEALVEAKRMNIILNWFNDKYPDNKYDKDAFIHLMMGLIYDANKEYNDACIAYKNAYEIYENDYIQDYALGRPDQLIEDIARTAKLAGLTADYEKYKAMVYVEEPERNAGSVVVLWHNGMNPKKEAESIEFRVSNVGGIVSFSDNSNNENYKFAASAIGTAAAINSIMTDQSGVYKMAFSKYTARKPVYKSATIQAVGSDFPKSFEMCEDIDAIAFQSHYDRKAREFSNALGRLIIREAEKYLAKKLAREGTKQLISTIGSATLGDVGTAAAQVGAGIITDGIIDAAMNSIERADLRQWSSLPHSIYYTRVFLEEGTHSLEFKAEGLEEHEETLTADVKSGTTSFKVVRTMEHNGLETLDRNSPEYARIKAEREETKRRLRAKTMFFKTIRPASWPSSSDRTKDPAVYFVAMYNVGDNVLVSNTFKVNGYSGGSWPFKNDIMKHIKESKNAKFKLIGFYETESEALSQKKQLEDRARNSFLTVSTFNIKQEFGYAVSSSSNQSHDPWSGSQNESNSGSNTNSNSGNGAFDDVWSRPGKKEEKTNTNSKAFDDPW